MRRVERGPAPDLVQGPDFVNLRQEYEAFRATGGSRVTQTKLDPRASLGAIESMAGGYVHDLFQGKCAYTEVAGETRFHLHRPEADAYDDRRGISAAHYWWTATWYRNWYLASNDVASLKRNNFPVLGERATEPTATSSDGAGEPTAPHLDRGVLLDPCEDRPEWHLRFDGDGTVRAWAESGVPWLGDEARRGPDTIRLLDLNAPLLVRSRLAAIAETVGRVDAAAELDPALLDPARAHLGAVRQVLAARFLEAGAPGERTAGLLAAELGPLLASQPGAHPSGLVELVRRHLVDVDATLAAHLQGPPEAGAIEVPTHAKPPSGPPVRGLTPHETAVIPRTAAITRAVISNFQAIERAELSIAVGEVVIPTDPLPPTPLTGRSWRALLGENGVGKSATLRAIGLALASSSLPDLEAAAGIDWSRLLRRGQKQGRVLLEFTDGSRIDLRFNRNRAWFVGGAPRMEGFVRGFGATRLLGPDDGSPEANVRLGNLFNPRIPVIDAEAWLLGIEEEGDFNVVAVAVAELLGRHDEVTGTVEPGAVPARFIQRVDGELSIGGEPLDNLSDGYRSVIATACDLMAGAGTGLSGMGNATGIVLIDELGAHMHPRWKMDITRTLRRVFPSMQFIVSTHEPLCLMGLVENEVVRVRSSSTRVGEPWHALFDPIEESPSRFRVDRLLTSAFFGLDTTIDPIVERQFREYYALIRKPTLTPEEDARRGELRATLSQHGVLGYTARDQMVYEAIDEFLAREPELEPGERLRQRKATLSQVGDIWRNVAERRRVTGRL